MRWLCFRAKPRITDVGSILARTLAKCELKKIFFLYLHFLASENLGPFSMVLILDIILFSSFLYVVH